MQRYTPYTFSLLGVIVLLGFIMAPMSLFYEPVFVLGVGAVIFALLVVFGLAVKQFWKFD